MLTSVSNPLGSGLVIGKMKKIAVIRIPTGLILNETNNYRGGAECLRHKTLIPISWTVSLHDSV